MTTTEWPQADARLERAYHRLLRTYPRRFRARHGAELVTTLLEMAAPGQRRPTRADALHLLAGGLRHRFRLPARRPLALVAAVLITLIGGAFGAAAGSWTATQTFADLPQPRALLDLAGGGTDDWWTIHDRSPWTAAMTMADSADVPHWDAEAARRRYAAAGWDVGPLTDPGGSAFTTDAGGATVPAPLTSYRFDATRDGVHTEVSGHFTGEHGMVGVTAWAVPTPAHLPLIAAGAALGLLAGWLLAAALTYRIAHSARPRTATALTAAALAALTLPTVALYGNVMRAFRYAGGDGVAFTVHSAFNPGPYYPFGPGWQILAYTIGGLLLGTLAATVARPGPAPQPATAP
ncbi:hypothetical protein [Actinoplanes sp. NPDC049316]|uniref:hypothetical protein n=1 Tax=Actinoplanes sp. NPDC049316 TaxID=3154727 RepID=UPI00342F8D9E